MSARREVGANLVSSARFGNDFQERKALESFDYPPLGDGTPRRAGVDGDPFSLPGMSSQGGFDDPLQRAHLPMNERDVSFSDPTGLELRRQVIMGPGVFRHHHDARGILVQAMDDSWPDYPVDLREIPAVKEQGIYKGAGINSRTRVNHQARGLVDDDDPWILVEDIQGDILGDYIKSSGWRDGPRDHIPLPQSRRRF